MEYKAMNDDNLLRISGGGRATNTIVSGISGAAGGVRLCTPIGPLAMAGCGVVGALIGGIWGYNAP